MMSNHVSYTQPHRSSVPYYTPGHADRFFFGGEEGASNAVKSCVFVIGFNSCVVVRYPFAAFEMNGDAVVGPLAVEGETGGISP